MQRIHYKLSATFSEKHCWLNFTCFLGLHNAVDSLALYIARIIVTRGWPARDSVQQRDQPEVRKEYCAVEFVSLIEASKLVAIKVESRS